MAPPVFGPPGFRTRILPRFNFPPPPPPPPPPLRQDQPDPLMQCPERQSVRTWLQQSSFPVEPLPLSEQFSATGPEQQSSDILASFQESPPSRSVSFGDLGKLSIEETRQHVLFAKPDTECGEAIAIARIKEQLWEALVDAFKSSDSCCLDAEKAGKCYGGKIDRAFSEEILSSESSSENVPSSVSKAHNLLSDGHITTPAPLEAEELFPAIQANYLSEFFLRHLPLLLSPTRREEGLSRLRANHEHLLACVSRTDVKNMKQAKSTSIKVHTRCVNFAKALGWALDDLHHKMTRNFSEVLVMKATQVIFVFVLSLNKRERGLDGGEVHEPDGSNSIPSSDIEPGIVENGPDATPFHPGFSFELPSDDQGRNLAGPSIPHPFFLSPYPLTTDNSSMANQNEEFMIQEELVFFERRLPLLNDDNLVTMFQSHMVPMTPVVARKDGRYVRGTQRTELSIMDAAYACDTPNGCVIPCEFVLNATYTPDNPTTQYSTRFLTYVGFVYPDNTMLSYIPIKNVRIVYRDSPHRQPILKSGTTTFAFLHMDLPNGVYQSLKRLAKEIYLREHPDMLFVDHFEELQGDGTQVRIEVLVKSERTVRIEDNGKYLEYPVLQALFWCRHDICGKSLMHLRFTSAKRGSQRMQLRLILFGITVERNLQNFNEPIFNLLNAPPGPIQVPCPTQGFCL